MPRSHPSFRSLAKRDRRFARLSLVLALTMSLLGCRPAQESSPPALPEDAKAQVTSQEPSRSKQAAKIVAAPRPISQQQEVAEPAKPEQATSDSEQDPGRQWLRVLSNDEGDPTSMQTAIVRYVPKGEAQTANPSVHVDLVAAVHVGDREYYEQLNERFKQYDAVLFELVAAEGVVVPKGRGTSNSHPLGALQNLMKDTLELEHQLELVDYTQENFIHADLSPTEFMQKMADRDESFTKLFMQMMGASTAQKREPSKRRKKKGSFVDAIVGIAAEQVGLQQAELDIARAMVSGDRPRRLKMAMARQFEGMESVMAVLGGPEGSTIITERNLRALEVLEEQLSGGDQRIAIFYGGGHLPDMDERMQKDFQMVPVSVEWIEAWNLRGE